MSKSVFWICLGIVLLPQVAGAADRNEVAELRKVVEQQRLLIEQLIGRIDGLDAKLAKQEKRTEEVANATLTETASWPELVKLHGDLRYRHELIKPAGKKNHNRNRIRARVGVDAKVNDSVDVGIQIASGSDDPVSTNQSLDGGFSSKEVWIDLAYFDWHPDSVPGLHVIGGKMKNPFYRHGKSELVWDGDLRPEGGGIKYARTVDGWEFSTNLGGFWVEEQGAGADTGLFGAQAVAKFSFPVLDDKGYVLAGGSYYDYGNTMGKAPMFDPTDPFGNTVDAGGNYSFDYDLVEVFAELGFKVCDIPVSLFGDYVVNTASAVMADRAWLVGTTIGKCNKPGSWALRYNYRDVEADSVLGAFADSDFIGGGTDGRGHELGFNYQIAEHWQAGATYFCNERGVSTGKTDYQRLQLDLQFKF